MYWRSSQRLLRDDTNMLDDTLVKIDVNEELVDRYHRQQLIPWWNQALLRQAKVLLIGAGALGNEVAKTLGLSGIGKLLVFDMDVVETSNLSRAVFLRTGDEGLNKAQLLADRIGHLNPDLHVVAYSSDLLSSAGLGIFDWADVVISAVDNRIARLFINRSCAWAGKPWIDGGIEGFSGIIRVFHPTKGPCYECTMNAVDRELVRQRMSCAMLARHAASQGQVPNTAINAAIVGAMQAQEAVKLIHSRTTLSGEGVHFNGLTAEFSRVRYQRKQDCLGHDYLPPWVATGWRSSETTLNEALSRAERELGQDASLQFSRDLITHFNCPGCGLRSPCGKALGTVWEDEAACPHCGEHRAVEFISSFSRDEDLDLSLTLSEIGIPPYDLLIARQGLQERRAWLLDGDARTVLGPIL